MGSVIDLELDTQRLPPLYFWQPQVMPKIQSGCRKTPPLCLKEGYIKQNISDTEEGKLRRKVWRPLTN
jgi:hypothetical protein